MKGTYEKICMNGKIISKLITNNYSKKHRTEQTEINHRAKLTKWKFQHKIADKSTPKRNWIYFVKAFVHKSTPKLNWIYFAKAIISFYKAIYKIKKALSSFHYKKNMMKFFFNMTKWVTCSTVAKLQLTNLNEVSEKHI